MLPGTGNNKGVMKWKMPSAGQAVIIIAIFVIPILCGVLFYEKMPPYIRTPLFILWFIAASVIYIYIISHGKGKQKSTVVEPSGLSGEFTIDNNGPAFLSIFFFASFTGAFLNGFYIIGLLLLITGFVIIYLSKLFRKKLRFDNYGNMYIIQGSNELFVDFSRLSYALCRLNKMSAEHVYRPRITLQFMQNIAEIKPVKLKINVLRSVNYGTYSPPQVILTYIKQKCIEAAMQITYLNPEETDFKAERI